MKNPYNEGSLQRIADLFIKPLIPLKPTNMSYKEWLRRIFHVETREISKYRARKPFNMLGHYLETANVKTQGIGYRPVKRNDLLWVRTDSTMPDKVEIEIQSGVGSKSQVFELNQEEWMRTEPLVRKLKK